MRERIAKCSLLIGCCLMGSIQMQAESQQQADTTANKVHALPNVTVQATQPQVKVTSTTLTQTLNCQRIEDLGIQGFADLLKRFSGVNIKDYGGIGGLKTVSVRNMGAAHTAISYDGIVIGNAQAGQVDIGKFSLDDIKQVSLSIGQNENLLQSARSYASAGILEIETEKPSLDSTSLKGTLQWRMASFGTYNPYLRLAKRIASKTILMGSLNYMKSDGDYPYTYMNFTKQESGYRKNSAVNQIHTEWNLFHDFTPHTRWQVKGYYYRGKRELPGSIIFYTDNPQEILWEENAFVQSKLNKDFSSLWKLQVLAKYNYAWNKYHNVSPQYGIDGQTDRYTQQEGYLSATLGYTPSRTLQISLAQDIVYNTLKSNLPDFAFPKRLYTLTALHATYRLNRLKLDGNLVYSFKTEKVTNGSRPDDFSQISPSIAVNYQPFEEQAFFLRTLYKRTFRLPTFNDLYYFRIGSPNLRPEKANELNLGLAYASDSWWIFNQLTGSVDVYWNEVSDKIVAFPTTYVWKMQNYGKARLLGFDANLTADILLTLQQKLALSGTFSYQRAINLDNPSDKSYHAQLPYSPRFSGNFSVIYHNPLVNLSYSLHGMSRRYFLSQNIPENRINGYIDQSISVFKILPWGKTQWKLQVDVTNIANKQYEIIKYYPMPRRAWRATIKLTF